MQNYATVFPRRMHNYAYGAQAYISRVCCILFSLIKSSSREFPTNAHTYIHIYRRHIYCFCIINNRSSSRLFPTHARTYIGTYSFVFLYEKQQQQQQSVSQPTYTRTLVHGATYSFFIINNRSTRRQFLKAIVNLLISGSHFVAVN